MSERVEQVAVVKAELKSERAEKRAARVTGQPVECQQCGVEMEPGVRRPKKFCSAKCRKAHARAAKDD